MGNRRRHIGSSLAALTLTLSLLTGLLTGCGPGGSQSSSPEAGQHAPGGQPEHADAGTARPARADHRYLRQRRGGLSGSGGQRQ